ncbi:MAG TPA: malate synthase A [Thermoanaerobaculia bacterium]|nr:malate synthase A [Thermoanaerobaculia bacterium]
MTASLQEPWAGILTPEAASFLAKLQRTFGARREELLALRLERAARLDAGELPDFLPETREIRESDWTTADIPPDLIDRRVEITGPTDRKMVINALNSGASVFMADFEDANAPTWANNLEGQINLRDAVRRTISFDSGTKEYRLEEQTATLMVRPRGWHLREEHFLVDEKPMSASLFDFGLYFFHNAKEAISRGTGPYFYLPKLESHLEARLWNDVFVFAQRELGVPNGSIRATVLIETILAAFEMHEILWELRDHSAGLNCGRWDYIFSFIKKFRAREDFITPDRGLISMDKDFLAAYVDLLIQTCHRRGIHAMGGMAAQIPIKNDVDANAAAMQKVEADKLREVKAGHDGTWVAHPGLVPIAKRIFDEHMPGPNQIDRKREDVRVSREDLLRLPKGPITERGVRQNINVGVLYLEAWLAGLGCVPLYNLMEDAATAEISRTQLWQWIHHGAILDDGRALDVALYSRLRDEELGSIRERLGAERVAAGFLEHAAHIFDELILADELADFLTIPAYHELLTLEKGAA